MAEHEIEIFDKNTFSVWVRVLGEMHAIKIDYAAWRRLIWLLIGMISLTKIPETHSSMNDINIEALAMAGGRVKTRDMVYDLNCRTLAF